MDLDGDRMWCSFIVPMVTHSEEGHGLDLSVPMYQIYMRGNTNYTKSCKRLICYINTLFNEYSIISILSTAYEAPSKKLLKNPPF